MYPKLNNSFICIVFALCYLLSVLNTFAQNEEIAVETTVLFASPTRIYIENFSPKDYNSHAQNWCITQDERGIIYIANSNGLLEYDGYKWKKYSTQNSSVVLSIGVDSYGRIWLGADGEANIMYADNTGKKIFHNACKLINKDSCLFSTVWNTNTDLVYNARGDKANVFNDFYKLNVISEDTSCTIYPIKKFWNSYKCFDRLWVDDVESGIFCLDDMQLKAVAGTKYFGDKTVHALLPYNNDKIVAVSEQGLYLWKVKDNKSYYFLDSLNDNNFQSNIEKLNTDFDLQISQAQLFGGLVTHNNQIALYTLRDGLFLANKNGNLLQHISRSDGLMCDMILYTYQDRANGLWLALNNGLARCDPYNPVTVVKEGEKFNGGIESIIRFDNFIYFATSQGVFRFYNPTKQSTSVPLVNSSSPHQSGIIEHILGISSDCWKLCIVGNDLYAAASNDGVYRILGKKSEKITDFMSYTLSDVSGKENIIIVGGRKGLAVIKRNSDGNFTTITHIKDIYDEIISLKQDYIISYFALSNDDQETKNQACYYFWAGLRKKGVALIKFSKNFSQYSIHLFGTANALPSGEIWTFSLKGLGSEDKLPQVVFGTNKGLYKYEMNNKKKDNSDKSKSYFSDLLSEMVFIHDSSLGDYFTDTTHQVFRLSQSINGNVWVASDKVKKVISLNNQIDSIPFLSLDIGQINAIFPDSNGICWIGGTDGLVRYNSSMKKNYKQVYHTLIRQVSIGKDSTIFYGDFWEYTATTRIPGKKEKVRKLLLDQPESFIPSIEYKDNSITFEFAAPFFEHSDKLLYSWRLVGYDTVWTKWQKENKAIYTNLFEGKYTFNVKAKNIYAHESLVGDYTFIVKPPWYRTWLAYCIYSIACILFIWLIVFINSRRLVAIKKRLEKTIMIRTAEIQDQKDQIENLFNIAVERKNTVEHQKEEIDQSIRYAKHIQTAVLPAEKYAQLILREHFIIFRPKDVVSGDFYWVTKKEEWTIITAADCTGHGVPGAFMSMLGMSFLNEIVRKKEIINTAEILNHLRISVIEALKQTSESGTQKDGMDMSIIAIHKDRKRALWAGANNPLWIIKQDTKSKDFEDKADMVEFIKGDSMPVAVHLKMDNFTNHEIELNKGDQIYMFSDGFPDQFGGPKGKKFMYKKFKRLIAEISNLTMKEQCEQLEKSFDNWINYDEKKYEQVDDVTIIGIKI